VDSHIKKMEIKPTENQKDANQQEVQDRLHMFDCQGHKFTVDKKYRFQEFLGYGIDGPECLVLDKNSNQLLAIKKIQNLFDNLFSARETVREICLTRFLDHENILKTVDIMQSETETGSQNVYVVTEFLEASLRQIIFSPQPLSNAHVQFFMYQILRGLLYLHSTGLIHRAFRSEVLLVNQQCDLKISRFRFAKPSQKKTGVDSEYISNRYYMSPEMLLGYQDTQAMDIWAAGCILGELLGRRVLFPGRDHQHQIQTIFGVTGTPEEGDFGLEIGQRVQKFLQNLPKTNKTPWNNLFPQADPMALDLLDNMLNINPKKRFTAFECLKHPYFEDIHDISDEPICKEKFFWDYQDSSKPTRASLQIVLDEEIQKIHPS